jgi:hypothetical protein
MGRPVLFVAREAGGWAGFVCEVSEVVSRDAVDAGAIGESPCRVEFGRGAKTPARCRHCENRRRKMAATTDRNVLRDMHLRDRSEHPKFSKL